MDQHSAASASSKLNAQAPEFVPSPVMNHHHKVYAAAPLRLPPPPPPAYFGYLQHNAMPFYGGYNVTQSSSSEVSPTDRTAPVVAANGHDKILNQVEFYFSDINLATTDQLFKYMVSDPEGYVPLSVVASFKKIKAAISGCTQLASILRGSKKLLVSEDGKNVKREHPLTESDMEELQSRIIIAENLPEDRSHQNLMKIFSSVGSVKSIRACPPQKSNGGMSPASKGGKGDTMHFTSKFHAFVEYESVDVAEKAVIELTDEGNWRNGLKVRLLLKTVKPTQTRGKRVGHEGQPITKNDESGVPDTQHLKGNQSENSLPQSDSQFHDRQSEDGNSNLHKKVRNNGGGSGKGKGKGKGNGQGRGRTIYPNNGGISTPFEASGSSEKLSIAKASAVPRMPDGTRGFSMGRGKPGAIKIS